ncbi:MAG TPA: hypothetical protein VNK89_14200 [Thermoflexus sp.]|nr:hypothetical protein [Thermoflexus sp.]
MTPSAPGVQHAWSLAVESGIVGQIPELTSVIGDTGFEGLPNDDPDRILATPRQAWQNPPLPPDPLRAHARSAPVQTMVEHPFRWRKRFRIWSSAFRLMRSLDDSVFLTVAGVGELPDGSKMPEGGFKSGGSLPDLS